ncbi:MAG TPA: hypothetical protein PK728_07085 [Bacillota bacterium]|nr:hypothetical protein [Bacillota bacterium]
MFDIKQLSNYKTYFDTCSLMHPPAWQYISGTLIPELRANGMTVTVPLHVLDELRKLQNREGDAGIQASMGMKAVAAMLEAGVLELSGAEEGSTFVDNYFLYTFTRLRLESNLALITQDKNLALDIHNLGQHRSVQGQKQFLLLKFEKDGLVEWEIDGGIYGKTAASKPPAVIRRGALAEKPSLPSTGSVVYSSRGPVKLKEKIFESASGVFYAAGSNLVCKIYSPEYAVLQRKKLLKMLNMHMSAEEICWPVDAVMHKNSGIAGYLAMPLIGISVKDAIFPKGRLAKVYPHWTRRNLVHLCIDVAAVVDRLHSAGVLFGSVSPSNILVDSDGKVKIVNVDEMQIDNCPCLCIDPDFVAPEVKHKKTGPVLATREQEYYGLAVLLFMILFPGKHPFSPGAGVMPGRMRLLEFPYPLGEKGGYYTPGPPWNFIWSNLPYRIKQMFYGTFKEGARMSPREWQLALKSHLYLLDTWQVSDEIFPACYKIINPVKAICARCGAVETQESRWVEALTAKGKNYLCEKCLNITKQKGGGNYGI